MLAGEPYAGNLHVRFDEGEQRDRRKPPVALYSTVLCGEEVPFLPQRAQSPQRSESKLSDSQFALSFVASVASYSVVPLKGGFSK